MYNDSFFPRRQAPRPEANCAAGLASELRMYSTTTTVAVLWSPIIVNFTVGISSWAGVVVVQTPTGRPNYPA